MIILPELPYGYADLQPVLSEATLRTHHGRHHARYVEVANRLLDGREAPEATLEEIVERAWRRSARKLFDNAAQALNHGFYWASMRPPRAPRPAGGPAALAGAGFADVGELRSAFLAEGGGHFGSGWVWLVSQHGKLSVLSTHDGDTAFRMDGLTPLLVCDVWEHAYYLDHRNDRAAYLAGWWDQLADWAFAARQYEASLGRAEPWRYPVAAAAAGHAVSPA